jgi:hypothetical protein
VLGTGSSRRVGGRALIVAVLACLAISGAGFAPAYASASTARFVTYLAGGHVASDGHYKPKSLTLSGDSTLFLNRARWHVWSNKRASGSAQTGWNDCKPDCAQGKIHWFLAKVSLSKPLKICGKHFFTEVTFHFTHGRPSGIPQNYRWDATPAC